MNSYRCPSVSWHRSWRSRQIRPHKQVVCLSSERGVSKLLPPVRFIRDEFHDNYDPTIEGIKPDLQLKLLSLAEPDVEEYRRPLMVDGELTSVCYTVIVVRAQTSHS